MHTPPHSSAARRTRKGVRMVPAPRAMFMFLLPPAPVPRGSRRVGRGCGGRGGGGLRGRERPAPDLRDPFFHVGFLRLLLDDPWVRKHLARRRARSGVDGEAIQTKRNRSVSVTVSGSGVLGSARNKMKVEEG